jgi:hypothetical protein
MYNKYSTIVTVYPNRVVQRKKKRTNRILEIIQPPFHRTQVPIRNLQSFAPLPREVRDLLATCLVRLGKIGFPKAIQKLRANPDISLESLMNKIATTSSTKTSQEGKVSPEDTVVLEGYITKCYPDMESISMHAIASSDAMTEAGELIAVLRKFSASNHSRSDFVNVVLYAILYESLEKHINNIKGIPAFVQAVQKTGLPWK